MSRRTINCVVAGDGGVGKRSLLITNILDRFPTKDDPNVAEDWTDTVTVAEQSYSLTLTHTAGLDDYERLRPLKYAGAHVFLLCYSIGSHKSLASIQRKWAPEIRALKPNAACVLVGTQLDLRYDSAERARQGSDRAVSREEGEEAAKEIGAAKYVECSALVLHGVKEVFREAVVAVLERPAKRSMCIIL